MTFSPDRVAAPAPEPRVYAGSARGVGRNRFGLPTPRWMLETGTFLMRTESELVLKSRRVVPGRLLAAGFHFLFPTWPAAARDLADRWR